MKMMGSRYSRAISEWRTLHKTVQFWLIKVFAIRFELLSLVTVTEACDYVTGGPMMRVTTNFFVTNLNSKNFKHCFRFSKMLKCLILHLSLASIICFNCLFPEIHPQRFRSCVTVFLINHRKYFSFILDQHFITFKRKEDWDKK